MKQTPDIPAGFVLRIGSRGSPLALAQVDLVKTALASHFPDLKTETIIIKTSGDWKPEDGETRLEDLHPQSGDNKLWAGKGLFVKEIEQALLEGRIDCAIHSAKDVESHLPGGLQIAHALPREDPRDALIFATAGHLSGNIGQNIQNLPPQFTIGTTSLRRQSQLLALNPNLNIVPLRGNVQTRLDKLQAGICDATILAHAGLKRLSIAPDHMAILPQNTLLPAAGQGIVCIETRQNDTQLSAILDQLSCSRTKTCLDIERAALQTLDGSCNTPIGVYAAFETPASDALTLRACIGKHDGSKLWKEEINANIRTLEEAQTLGRQMGETLKNQIPASLLKTG